MALSTATITLNISDMLGVDFDARRTKIWVTTNIDGDTVVDTVGNAIRLGSGTVTLGTDGTASLAVWIPGAGSNPASWQTYVHIDYADAAKRTREVRDFGPFTITGNADLADLIAEQEIPPNYAAGFIAQAQSYLDQQESLAGIDSSDSATAYNATNGPLTKAALSASFAARQNPALELVPYTAFGNSYVGLASTGAVDGTKYFDRFAIRNRTQTMVNRGNSGALTPTILTTIENNWVSNKNGLVGLGDVVVNDLRTWLTDVDKATSRETFRAMLARLSSWSIQGAGSASLIYGPGWTAGVSSAAAYVDVAWTGPAVDILVGCVTSAGTTLTVTDNTTGATVATFTTGGYRAAFTGVIHLAGYSSGAHTVRVTTAGAASVLGCIVPMPNPPLIMWLKPGATTENGSTQATRLALYLAELATVAAGYSNVIPVDAGPGWDPATMLAPDGLHPNDRGHAYLADRLQTVMGAVPYTQGLNSLGGAGNGLGAGTYTPPVPAYSTTGATVPAQITGFTATPGAQMAFAWTRPSDGGATITSQVIESSPAGAGTWTTLATVGAAVNSSVVPSGLTAGTSYDFRVKAVNTKGSGTPSATATATAPTPVVIYAFDDFNRADSATLGNTPTGNFPWTAGSVPGAFAIATNQLRIATAPAERYIDDGQANGSVSVKLTGSTAVTAGLWVRRGASNTGFFVYHDSGSFVGYRISKKNTAANDFTTLATYTGTPAAVNDVLKVVMNGSSLTVVLNGVVLGTVTNVNDQTATQHGVLGLAGTVGFTYDDFQHTDSVATP